MSCLTTKTVYKTVNQKNLNEELQLQISEAKKGNLDLVVREIENVEGECKLVLDFKRKAKYDIQLESLKTVSDVVTKIDELNKKKEYWLKQLNEIQPEIYQEENLRHFSERQYEHFEGAISALEYILGKKNCE